MEVECRLLELRPRNGDRVADVGRGVSKGGVDCRGEMAWNGSEEGVTRSIPEHWRKTAGGRMWLEYRKQVLYADGGRIFGIGLLAEGGLVDAAGQSVL